MFGIAVFVGEPFKSRRIMQQHRKDEHLKDIVLTNKFAGYHPDVNKPCRFCGTIFKKQSGLTLHEKTCIENPNKIKIKGHKTSDETKKKLSEIAIKNLRGTHTNWINKKKSYAEEYFDKIFLDAEKQYRVNRFVLDYAWPEKKIYIEVDGEQHYTEEGLNHDKIRTEILLEEGWVCAKRIRWSNFQKLTRKEKEEFIKNLPRVSETDNHSRLITLEILGPTPRPAILVLSIKQIGSLQFSPPIKRKSIEIVVTSLGCCSTQSTLANVRVLFC